jgi:hypothetical protein
MIPGILPSHSSFFLTLAAAPGFALAAMHAQVVRAQAFGLLIFQRHVAF